MVKRPFQSASQRAFATAGRRPRGRVLVASGTGVIAVTYGVVRFGYGLQLPQLSEQFSLSSTTAGAIASGSFAAYCVAAVVAQRLVPARGARSALWLAAGLAAAGAALVGLAWSAPALAVGVLVAGGAAGAASPALVVAVASSVPGPRAGRAQAVVNSGTGLGVVLAGAVVLVAPQSWRLVWFAAAAAALATVAGADRAATWPQRPSQPAGAPRDQDRSRRDTSVVRPAVAAAVVGLGSAAVWTFGRDLVTSTGGLPGRTTAVLWVLLGAAALLGAASGDAVRRLGLRRSWTTTVTLAASATAALALAPGEPVLVAVAVTVFGGAYTALSGVLIAWAGQVRPHAAGTATATLFTALTAGQAVGAAATGLLAGEVGLPLAFGVCAAAVLSAALAAPPRPPRPPCPSSHGDPGPARSVQSL